MLPRKSAGGAAAREKKTGKTKEEVFLCGEGGHAGGRRRQGVFARSVWRLSTVATPDGQAERRRFK